jgi:hypothetical protein
MKSVQELGKDHLSYEDDGPSSAHRPYSSSTLGVGWLLWRWLKNAMWAFWNIERGARGQLAGVVEAGHQTLLQPYM